MNPLTIHVSQYQTTLPRGNEKNDAAGPRVRYRWRAAFLAAPSQAAVADACISPDQAIGLLIRRQCQFEVALAAEAIAAVDTTIGIVASLFGDLSVRSADEQLGRAVRLAARNPRRLNPGCRVEIEDAAVLTAVGKGGAK